MVDFIIQPQMCDDCHRVEAKDYWKAVVQVRQKVNSNFDLSLMWQHNFCIGELKIEARLV